MQMVISKIHLEETQESPSIKNKRSSKSKSLKMALSVHHSKSELIDMEAKIQIVYKVLSLATTQPSNQEEGLVNGGYQNIHPL